MQPPQTFTKAERLCNRKLIGKLFSKSKSFYLFPFKIMFLEVQQEDQLLFENRYPAQVLFTIPKRKFKKAVMRNRLKRLMREGYRKNKHELYEALRQKNRFVALGFIYTGKDLRTYHELEKKIKAVIMRLKQEIKETEHKHANHDKP